MSKRSVAAEAKAAERHVAEVMDGRRLVAGEHKGPGDVDGDGGWWAAQVKHVSNVPQWLSRGMEQIEQACTGTEKLPLLVVVTKPGTGRTSRMFVIMDAEAWAKEYGR